MLERLSDLKGNRIKEVSNPASDARNSLKKFISQISKQRSCMLIAIITILSFTYLILTIIYYWIIVPTLEPLQFSLKGLRTKAATGQWWHTSQLNNQELAEIKKDKKDISQKIKEEEEAMMKLARSHGMNTDVRRSIFVNLMNSEVCIYGMYEILRRCEYLLIDIIILGLFGCSRTYSCSWIEWSTEKRYCPCHLTLCRDGKFIYFVKKDLCYHF